ncbi:hypothetical protein E6O75_ATG00736 [Venturia nashicola]|uniref:CUE domain-containing protein n=1 Tax=Venturia nashicola TaxID=86259 RepID=A0A4Z1PP49_9PEZI|nr:hypothetical protein E6O75_ATG00736 [Venturia nashicola]
MAPKHSGAESPTTAREPDFDHDDDNHESSSHAPPERLPTPTSQPKRVSFQEVTDEDEAPPAKPPRPVDPQVQAQQTLQEAFPTMDSKVIKAVLLASGGQVEPAFNALLSMSDPDFQAEEAAPPQPPRPAQRQEHNQYRELSQLEKDELYARQLAEQYQSGPAGFGSQERGNPPLPKRRTDNGLKANEMYDKEHSFFDDDLPVIKQQLQKGFQDTQKTFNKWITEFKKKIDGDEDDEPPLAQSSRQGAQQRQNFGPSQSEQMRGIRKMSQEQSRRSGDRERYDADPRVLSDDFRELELHDDNGTTPAQLNDFLSTNSPQGNQRQGTRPLANPNLFKPTPAAPQSGPVDEVDALYRQPSPSNGMTTGTIPSSTSKTAGKKWQPLTSVAPNPEAEDNDPFSLGDSDEEDRKTDLKPEDTERLKESAKKSISEGTSGTALKKEDSSLAEAEKAGTKNKEAEELLKGKE